MSLTTESLKAFLQSIGRNEGLSTNQQMLHTDAILEIPAQSANPVIPHTGTFSGVASIQDWHKIRSSVIEFKKYTVKDVIVSGGKGSALVHVNAVHKQSEAEYEIEEAHFVGCTNQGKIQTWKILYDSEPEVRVFRQNLNTRLIAAVESGDGQAVRECLENGANPNTKSTESGLSVLMIASGQGNAEIVRTLLAAGADLLMADNAGGATAIHKACQGGSLETVQLLVDAGAFIDTIVPRTGHSPLIEALWFKQPEIAGYLLDRGAGLKINTHYGFSLLDHFNYALKVNTIGKEKLLEADRLLKERQKSDAAMVEKQVLMQAVNEGDLEKVKSLIQAGAQIDERAPVLNGFNDYHTPLLVACRDGHLEIARVLLKAGADVNATEPTFGAVPLHKATYNGHADMTRLLTEQPGVDLDFPGATNGYTPLHDALWHGFEECSEILIKAGARLDLRGHDGKTPPDIARETFGESHRLVKMMEARN